MNRRRASDAAIRRILTKSLQREVVSISRQPNDYASSFELQDLDVILEDGTRLEMVFKDVGPQAILPAARDSKQELFFNPMREIGVYRNLLSPTRHGTAICHACEAESAKDRYWIFLERINGLKLTFTGDFAVWLDAVRLLGQFHSEFAPRVEEVRQSVPLIEYDRAYYQRWCDRAVDFVARTAPDSSPAMRQVAGRYDRVVDRLLALPVTLCHGDCYPSNILVRETRGTQPVCIVDWELAAIAPGVVDVASLTAGKWSDDEKDRFVTAYWSSLSPEVRNHWTVDEQFKEDLTFARLQLAVQWLGWSPRWAPPIDQANNWLREMISLATQLSLL